MQDGRGKKRHRQRHDPGKQSACMRCGREHQARIREQHGGAAAEHDRREPNPAEAVQGETLARDVRQQQQAGNAKTKRRDVPGREAGAESRRATTIHPDQMLTAARP